jgi:SM-20-related protein
MTATRARPLGSAERVESGGDPEPLASALEARGWAVTDDWLPTSLTARLREDCRRLAESHELRLAAIGAGVERQVRTDIRGDLVQWLEDTASQAGLEYRQRLEALRVALNRRLMLGLFEFEGHFAAYPPGTFYARHLDRFRDGGARVVSVVAYLNPDWVADDGGHLRLYLDEENAVDIAPEFGRVVAFWSDRFHHEVLLAQRWRYSITGWLRRRTG